MEDVNCWLEKFEECSYSNKLLTKLLLLNKTSDNKIDITEVKKAIYYARKYHGEQKRQSGEPYYSHPIEVAFMVSDYLLRTDILVTSILHDVLEDTKMTFEMIKAIFGERVANQVMDLTRIKGDGNKISSEAMVNSLWLQKKYDLLFIKEMDRLHNMRTIGFKSSEKAGKISRETLGAFLVLAAYLGLNNVEEELRQLCAHLLAPNKAHLQKKRTFNENNHLPSLAFQNGLDHKKNL